MDITPHPHHRRHPGPCQDADPEDPLRAGADSPALESSEAVHRHLESVIAPADRRSYTAYAVLCDARSRPVLHCAVDDCAPEPTVDECARAAGAFASGLAFQVPDGQLLLAVTRPGGTHPNESDRRWYQGLNRACARHDVRPLGTYVVTPDTVFRVTLDDIL